MQHLKRWFIVTVFVLFVGSVCTFGQKVTASLGGKVTDPNGRVIQNAIVVVTAEATGVTRKTATNEDGNWRVEGLVPGLYDFEVTAPGFKSEHWPSIDLQVNDQKLSMDTQLTVGTSTESVKVVATTPLIDTTSAVAGTVLTSEQMEELPTLTNAPSMFIALVPGSTVTNGMANSGVYLWSNTGLTEIAINGTGSTGGVTSNTNYLYEGGSDVNNLSQLAFEPPVDAVGELRIITNAYDASLGRTVDTTVMMASKTGGKQFHGDVYYDNQNDFLNANTYANDNSHTAMTPIHIHYYGGTVGGPVWIPKFMHSRFDPSYDGRKKGLFFFFSYSGIHSVSPTNQGYMSVPDAAERTGDFSSSYTVSNGVTYPIKIYDPYSVYNNGSGTYLRTEVPNDIIPSAYMNPIAKAIVNLIGPPNSPAETANGNDSNNYRYNLYQICNLDSEILRLDKAWNNENHTYLNLYRNNWKGTQPSWFGNTQYNSVTYNMVQNPNQYRINRGFTLDHSIVLSKNIVLDLNYHLLNYWLNNVSPTSGMDPTALGFSSTFKNQMQYVGIPVLTGVISQSLGTTYSINAENDMNHDINISVTQMKGNHAFHYGVDWMIRQAATATATSATGSFAFGSNWDNYTPNGTNPTGAGSAFGDFLMGLPTSGSIPWNATGMWSQHYGAVYFQDDWRVTPKLTLNVGLRWDYERPVTERFNKMVVGFDPNYVLTDITTAAQAKYATLLGGSSANNTGLALLQTYRSDVSTFVAKGGLLYAGQDGNRLYVLNPRYKYFQPRFGFAYRLAPNMVIRGGFGRFVEADFSSEGSQTGWSNSTNMVTTTNSYESAPNISLANPFPNGLNALTGNSQGKLTNVGTQGSYTDPNFGRQYGDIVGIALQHEIKGFLIDTSFMLNKQHGIGMSYEVNDPTAEEWHAAYDPQFTSTGAPVLTLSGNTTVSNPFYHIPGIYTTASDYTSTTISVYQLLRPNPLLGNLTETRGTGSTRYYALQNKVERRWHNGFSLLSSFTWGKMLAADTFIGSQTDPKLFHTFHMLDSSDTKFHYVVTPIYELPIGRGKPFANHINKLTNELIGGWELAGTYTFQSGTPLVFPTNSSFFAGGSPSLGSKKTATQWFDTSKFYMFPNSSTTKATMATYPNWTGVQNLPGYSWVPTPSVSGYSNINNGVFNDFNTRLTYNPTTFGDVRNPYITNFTLGARKKFFLRENVPFEFGFDAFNALNHPQFGNINVTPGATYFGYLGGSLSSKWTQVNSPRTIQLTGKITF